MKDQPELGIRVYEGQIFNVYERKVALADGRSFVQELVSCPDVVRVYPVWGGDELMLLKERRHEIGVDVLRVVSGRVETSESPRDAAVRELEEELGFHAANISCFAQSHPMLKVRHTVHHFLALDPTPVPRRLEVGEIIDPVRVRLSDVEGMVFGEAIQEDVVALALLKLVRCLDEQASTRGQRL